MDFEKIGKYKILGEIGQGAMGVVYKAHDPILNRYVAIKMISASLGADDELRKRFHREAQAAARLNHPNIITVFDFGEELGKIYMAMELLEGTDLKDVMAAGSLANLDDKLAVMDQILDGLAFAHAGEIVHRDLKPGNIHIQPNGQIKIMDFGLARLGSSEMTQAGVVMGTPNYMSPEQVLGEKVDSRSDIFAMGAVFYEMLTNHKPFEAESMHGVLFQVVHKEPQEIRQFAPDLPPVLVQIVEKCLAKDKTRRFQNAGELREAVGVVRQALAAGRIHEATLDTDSGQVFFTADEFDDADGSYPPARPGAEAPETWSEGTVNVSGAAPPAPEPEGPASRSQPRLSVRSRAPAPRQAPARRPAPPVPPPAPAPTPSPSRAPLFVGGLVALALLVGGIWLATRTPPSRGPSAVLLLLVETRNEVAQGALDNKDFKKAIDTVESTLSMAKAEGVADGQKQVVDAQKILAEARTKFTAIETTATEAEDAFRANDMGTAATKLAQLLELDPQHPVAKELSGQLNQQFSAQAAAARKAMADARDQADKINNSASAEFRAQGRADFGKANDAASAAEASLASKAYAQATQKFLEARDAYDRARRAVESRMAQAAQQNKELAQRLRVPAEEARTNTARARSAAEQAGAASSAAAQQEFRAAVARAAEAESAMSGNDYLAAKKAFDDARATFERARTAALLPTPAPATQPPLTQPPATQPPATQPPATLTPATQPPVVAPPRVPIGRLVANGPDLTDVTSAEMAKKGLSGAANPDFVGTLEFEVSPADIAVGESFEIKVYLSNKGRKAMKLKDLAVTTRVNAKPGPPLDASLAAKEVDVGQRTLITQVSGSLQDGVRSWIMEARITGDKGDTCSNKVVLRK